MKVKFFDKNILKRFGVIISGISVALSVILVFFDLPKGSKNLIGLFFFIGLVIIYIGIWLWANKTKSVIIKIGTTSIEIKTGNIFEQDGLKAIAFNEYFDTKVDDKIISKASLNGQTIEKYFPDVGQLDKKIGNDRFLNTEDNTVEKNIQREGKSTQYKLGSSIEIDGFILTAFSRFSDKNEAQLTMHEYIDFLLSFWNEINRIYAQRSVSVPIFGAGITRFKNGFEDIDINELLQIMVWTFKVSKIKFAYPAKLTIIVNEKLIDRINLFKIKENE